MPQAIARLCNAGFTFEDANQIRRIEMTLHRWAELECGDGNEFSSWSIERDENDEIPYMVVHPYSGAKSYRRKVADREKGALARLRAILARYPDWTYYHQTDPRGCAVYIIRKADLQPGRDISSNYTIGIAV